MSSDTSRSTPAYDHRLPPPRRHPGTPAQGRRQHRVPPRPRHQEERGRGTAPAVRCGAQPEQQPVAHPIRRAQGEQQHPPQGTPMKVRVSDHAIQRAYERFPELLPLPRDTVYKIIVSIGNQGVEIASMFPRERYRVGCLRDGSPMILSMKPATEYRTLQDCLLVTTVMTDAMVLPHAMLGHTAKAVHQAKLAWRGTQVTPG